MEASRGLAVVSFLCPARQAFLTVTTLKDLQSMDTFPLVLGADLSLFQDGFADLRPKMTGAAQSLHTVS